MKKLLALVLALVMTLSLAVVGSNAAFKDAKDTTETYAEAVDVLSGMGVFNGYKNADGTYSFQPKGEITRAEVAAIVYRLYTADVTDKQASLYATYNKFNDMNGAAWAAGYIGYCANAGLVKGYDAKTFGPADKVTGYQALAMILRAVGYDKNGEFTGAQWQLHVAQTAQQLGILANVKGVDLNAAATRELVAELLFQTATVPMVSYTPAFGYVANSIVGAQKSLGEKNFGLKRTDGTNDVWGRPSHKWNYTTGNKVTVVVDKAAASYTTKVSECDIAKDLGIATAKKVEKLYIDGAVTAGITSINPLKTTSIVGDQGTVTEVFAMADGTYRIVEINTYLAKVTKVDAAYADKNGHTVDATVNLSAWMTEANHEQTTAFVGVEAEGFAVNDYVLVNVSNPKTYAANVETIAKATIAGSGLYKSFTKAASTSVDPDTTTISETKYNDAAKFFFGNTKPAGAFGGNYDVIVDAYGNVIGLAPAAKNYLAIEAVRWLGDGSTALGGKAVANVVLADGTRLQGVTIASVGKCAANGNSAGQGTPNTASFDTTWTTNGDYYNHLIAYSVNAEGNYELALNDNTVCAGNTLYNAKISNGQTIMNGTVAEGTSSTPSAVGVNDNTIFLVKDKATAASNPTYTAYTGKQNVPSMTGATVCYLVVGNYATVVLVSDYTLASNTFNAYVDADATYTGRTTDKGYEFAIYPEGTDTVKYVYYRDAKLPMKWANGVDVAGDRDGMFTFVIDSKGIVDSCTALLATELSSVTGTGAAYGVVSGNYLWDRNFVKSNVGGNMYCDLADTSATNTNTYWGDAATYINVSYNTKGEMTGIKTYEGKDAYQNIDWTSKNVQVLVSYTVVAGVKQAKYVYVIDQATSSASVDVTANAVVAAAGCDLDKYVQDVAFTAKLTDSKGVSTDVVIAKSDVTWKYYPTNSADGTLATETTRFAAGNTYYATFTLEAPLGVELTGVSAKWNKAVATLDGNVVTYMIKF